MCRSYLRVGEYTAVLGYSTICGKAQEYQLEEDLATDQVSLKEYMDPFTGERKK